jgi:hypothetical protein
LYAGLQLVHEDPDLEAECVFFSSLSFITVLKYFSRFTTQEIAAYDSFMNIEPTLSQVLDNFRPGLIHAFACLVRKADCMHYHLLKFLPF